MTSQIESLEFELANNELVRVGIEGWDVALHAVFFEHVKEGGLASDIEAEEEDLGIFVVQAKRG